MVPSHTSYSCSNEITGVFHWSVDNYPLGRIAELFQGHHDTPWTITYRQTCNNLAPGAKVILPQIAALSAALYAGAGPGKEVAMVFT